MNPWLHIPIADYEAHMAMPGIAQSQMLAVEMQRFVKRVLPEALAVLGASGGNGLELVDSAVTHRVVAVDVNREYLDLCVKRHAKRFRCFEAVEHDLLLGVPDVQPVDALFAGLILEYLELKDACGILATMLKSEGWLQTIVQLVAPDLPKVSDSPYRSLEVLSDAFHPVEPDELKVRLRQSGFRCVDEEVVTLESGKRFFSALWQKNRV